jgi:imidazolonepropionase-like amidohydrolase
MKKLLIEIRPAVLLVILICTTATNGLAQNVAVRNATILTITNGIVENGTVVSRDGKIVAVGTEVDIPNGTTVIDGTGMYLMPGLIDAHSHAAIDSGINEGSESVTPEVQVQVMNDDPTIYQALAGGATTAHLLHGSANTIGGQSQVIKMRWGKSVEEILFEGAPRLVKFALGENVTRAGRGNLPDSLRRYPKSRMGVEHTLRWWFTEAQKYRTGWEDYHSNGGLEPRRDLRLEALVDIMEGEIRVHAHSYRADEILMLIRVAEQFGFRINTFQHVLEGYKVAKEIADHGAHASTFADFWGYKVEAYDAIPHNMAIMASRGIVVSVNSDSGERIRRLYQEAAFGMKYGGMSEEEALKMITINPAIQIGVENRVGSIEVGKDADLALFSHHPFHPSTKVEKTIVDGIVYFDRDQADTMAKLLANKDGMEEQR